MARSNGWARARKSRIGGKMYDRLFPNKTIQNVWGANSGIMYITSSGDVCRNVHTNKKNMRLYSMDRTTPYNSGSIAIYKRADGEVLCENQHYSRIVIMRSLFIVDSSGGCTKQKKCSKCKVYQDDNSFNKNKSWCRTCQAEAKLEYRKTDGYVYSKDKRMNRMKTTSDGTVKLAAIKAMWRLQLGECNRCKGKIPTRDTFHIDHIIPIAKGGHHKMANIQLLCVSCNLIKSDKIA